MSDNQVPEQLPLFEIAESNDIPTTRPSDQPTNTYHRRIEDGVTALSEQMKLGTTQALETFLRFSAQFREYSTANQLLIAWQCPFATKVASYKLWEELGYHVKRGAKSIKILAPRQYRKKKESRPPNGEPQDNAEGISEIVLGFVPVSVFDASQLVEIDDKPLPDFFRPLEGDHEQLLACLTLCAQAAGFTVVYASTDHVKQHVNAPAPQGYLDSTDKIVIRPELDSTRRFLTLAHEYAHGLHRHLPRGMKGKVAECQAEATAYLVGYTYGIESPFSSDYLQNWGNTPTDLLAELDEVRAVATRIISEIDAGISLHDPFLEMKTRRRGAPAQKSSRNIGHQHRQHHKRTRD